MQLSDIQIRFFNAMLFFDKRSARLTPVPEGVRGGL